jgi:hypothetical protein
MTQWINASLNGNNGHKTGNNAQWTLNNDHGQRNEMPAAEMKEMETHLIMQDLNL